jgi:hypothetical protein
VASQDAVVHTRIGGTFFGNHQRKDFGTFQVYYTGALAISSGVYEGDGDSYGSDHPGNLDSLLNDGYADMGRVTAHAFGPDPNAPEYSYIAGAITGAHLDAKVSEVSRSMVALDTGDPTYPCVLVVSDRGHIDRSRGPGFFTAGLGRQRPRLVVRGRGALSPLGTRSARDPPGGGPPPSRPGGEAGGRRRQPVRTRPRMNANRDAQPCLPACLCGGRQAGRDGRDHVRPVYPCSRPSAVACAVRGPYFPRAAARRRDPPGRTGYWEGDPLPAPRGQARQAGVPSVRVTGVDAGRRALSETAVPCLSTSSRPR